MLIIRQILVGLLLVDYCLGFISKAKLIRDLKEIKDKKLGKILYEIVEHSDHDNYDLEKDLNITNNKTAIVEQMLSDQFLKELIRKNKHKVIESGGFDQESQQQIEVNLDPSKYKKITRNNSQIVVEMVVYKDSRQSEYYKELSEKMELELMINETIDLIEKQQKNGSSYLNQTVNGQLLLEQSLEIIDEIREPQVVPPDNKKITEEQRERIMEMLEIMKKSVGQLELPDIIVKEYLQELDYIDKKVGQNRTVDDEVVQKFTNLMKDIVNEHEVIQDHLENQEMIETMKKDFRNMRQAHRMLHQLVHLKRLFVKGREQLEDFEQLSFRDLNKQIQRLIQDNVGGVSVYRRVQEKVDKLMMVKVPILNKVQQQEEVQKWLWSALLSEKLNDLIDYVQDQSYYYAMIDNVIRIKQIGQDIIEELVIDNHSSLEQKYQKLWEQLQAIQAASDGDQFINKLIEQIAEMLDFVRKVNQMPSLPQNISYQELKMFQSYEHCQKIEKQRTLLQRQIEHIAMKELFFVSLRFFYEITEVLGDLLINNSCQLNQIISKFMNSIRMNESDRQKVEIQRDIETFNPDNDLNSISYLEIQNYLDFYKEYQSLYLDNRMSISESIIKMNGTLQTDILEQDKSVKLLSIYTKMVDQSLQLSFQQKFNHIYHETMELHKQPLVKQYKEFFEFVIIFGKQISKVNVNMNVNVFWFRILFKYYQNLGRMLKMIDSRRSDENGLDELADIHHELFQLMKQNVNVNVVEKYMKEKRVARGVSELIYGINGGVYGDTYQGLLMEIVNDQVPQKLKNLVAELVASIKKRNREGGVDVGVKDKVEQIKKEVEQLDQSVVSKLKIMMDQYYKIERVISQPIFDTVYKSKDIFKLSPNNTNVDVPLDKDNSKDSNKDNNKDSSKDSSNLENDKGVATNHLNNSNATDNNNSNNSSSNNTADTHANYTINDNVKNNSSVINHIDKNGTNYSNNTNHTNNPNDTISIEFDDDHKIYYFHTNQRKLSGNNQDSKKTSNTFSTKSDSTEHPKQPRMYGTSKRLKYRHSIKPLAKH